MNIAFGIITSLQYKVKNLTDRVRSFESGEKYTAMEAKFKTLLSGRDSEIRRLNTELSASTRQLVTMRHKWQEVFDDLENEHKKELAKKDREIEIWKERALEVERQRDEYRTELREKSKELYKVKTELLDEQGKNLKLKAQINRDYENSSIPSSQRPNHKKIANNREKTGKKPGGQPGHIGHVRKRHEPTNRIEIPAPDKYMNSPDFKPTGKIITKQLIGICVNVTVNEYATPEFRNVRTGQRVHADFPDGVVNDVNYDGSVKAFAFLLNNHCNVSIGKVSDFLSQLTGGQLTVSAGMINGLSQEFSLKTELEQKKAFADMLLAPVINTDFTSARVNGRNVNVIVCATPSSVLYFAREHKGHKGIEGTPVEDSQNILIHDHDRTFYNYGGLHQECLDHVSRYLKDSMDNEPNLLWNTQMHALIREMIHFRNTLNEDDNRNPDQIDPDKVRGFEIKYDEILVLAKNEYEYEPPNKYFIEGFNLYKRLLEYRDSHLLFLHDRKVQPTNNLSERLLRVFKRKQKQMMTFRSDGSLDYLCRSLGTIASLRSQGDNLYDSISSVFDA
jgi:hypothetical protein